MNKKKKKLTRKKGMNDGKMILINEFSFQSLCAFVARFHSLLHKKAKRSDDPEWKYLNQNACII